ncbi:hypothetical protein M0805_003833 [Coniferiporia weirii]|nr:hypothetical protein M0805_003833 [Coniferiporia weirii]
MPSFRDDLEDTCPLLWKDFCVLEGDESRHWNSTINGSVQCLDRDWRKVVFRFCDYFLVNKGLVCSPYHPDGRRLETIVYPFRYYFGQILLRPDLVNKKGSDVFEHIKLDTCSEVNLADRWPWCPTSVAEAISNESEAGAEANAILDNIGNDVGVDEPLASDFRNFRKCLEKADEHDLGRILYSSMNSCPRQELLNLPDGKLQKVMSMMQRIIDHKVTNCDVLRKILYDIVDERHVLPDCLKLPNITWDDGFQSKPVKGGGMADIYRGRYNGQILALKRIRSFESNSDDSVLEICKEAIVWRQLTHLNVLPFYGICDSLFAPSIALVSPWVENGDLADFSKLDGISFRNINGIDFMLQIARGLVYLHDQEPQIIHSDLRGKNILVEELGNRKFRLRLTDFGITKISQISTKMTTVISKGTPRWMSPELLSPPKGSNGSTTTKSDVYAYAMTCIEIFTGNIPFPDLTRDASVIFEVAGQKKRPEKPCTSPVADARGLDDDIWHLIARCWEHEHTRRPCMIEVVETLEGPVLQRILNSIDAFLAAAPSQTDLFLDIVSDRPASTPGSTSSRASPSPITYQQKQRYSRAPPDSISPPLPPSPSSSMLNGNAVPFTPGGRVAPRVKICESDGTPLDLDAIRKNRPSGRRRKRSRLSIPQTPQTPLQPELFWSSPYGTGPRVRVVTEADDFGPDNRDTEAILSDMGKLSLSGEMVDYRPADISLLTTECTSPSSSRLFGSDATLLLAQNPEAPSWGCVGFGCEDDLDPSTPTLVIDEDRSFLDDTINSSPPLRLSYVECKQDEGVYRIPEKKEATRSRSLQAKDPPRLNTRLRPSASEFVPRLSSVIGTRTNKTSAFLESTQDRPYVDASDIVESPQLIGSRFLHSESGSAVMMTHNNQALLRTEPEMSLGPESSGHFIQPNRPLNRDALVFRPSWGTK